MVEQAFEAFQVGGGRLVDVGCGRGGLWPFVRHRFSSYCGLDAVRYDGFPSDGVFSRVDLDAAEWPVADGSADVVTAVETIEHIENPWAFMRRLADAVRSGGWVVVTTPNQLSVLSLITLVARRRFSAFQDAHYPAHRTALLECDLERATREAGLDPVSIAYSLHGRLPLTPWHYPAALARLCPRAASDNLMIVARKGGAPR
jgi:2-polyprenyl-3-methyl-5-hydroxy-6-metoxy-1,4-benzoquinol methylase